MQSFNIYSTTVITGDSLIQLASNNTVGDIVDIGFYGASNTGAAVVYHGLVREGTGDPNAGYFYLFKNLSTNPTGNVVTFANATRGTLVANLTLGVISNLANSINVIDGGTGQSTLATGQIIIGAGQNPVQSLSNSSFSVTGTGTQNNTVTSVTVDAWGRTTALTYSQIVGLTVGQGGTGQTTFTTNGLIFGNAASGLGVTVAAGTSDQTFSNQILTVTNAGVPIWANSLDGGQF